MEINSSIKIRNYKCFGDELQGFDKILPLNIIIGKNNSGKSTLLQLVNFIIQGNSEFLVNAADSIPPEVVITKIIDDEVSIFPSNTRGGEIPARAYNNHREYADKHLVGKEVVYKYLGKDGGNHKKSILNWKEINVEGIDPPYKNAFARSIELPFEGKNLRYISAERDIRHEEDISSFQREYDFSANGQGITTFIQQILNRTEFDSNLIDNALLENLNRIIQPEMHFDKIVVQRDSNNYWEIYFDDSDNRIALSKMGSGIKTIIQVLLNLLIIPEHKKKHKNDFVFAFEELENNLHPAILRRLFSFISDYSKANDVYFFITTHSNVVIDVFGINPNAQLIHINKVDGTSKVQTILSYAQTKKVLKDLDIRASDLLQSNGIIWVEGPSDRIYLNRWFNILAPELLEGVHYSIMFYGGRLLANTTVEEEWLQKDVVPLLKINTNAFIIVDRDGNSGDAKLNDTKNRIMEEIGGDNCWVTKGREIENYLSEKTLSNWLKTDYGRAVIVSGNQNKKLENILKESDSTMKIEYNKNKKGFATEISKYIDEHDLNILDLAEKVRGVISKIKEWNSMAK